MPTKHINLLTIDYLRDTLKKCIEFTLPKTRINLLQFGTRAVSHDILSADLWVIQAFKDANNPTGFRTAHNLAGQIRCLLFFLCVPDNFPGHGPFWCHILDWHFIDRLQASMKAPIASKNDFDQLVELWPLLAYEPKDGHHHGHGY